MSVFEKNKKLINDLCFGVDYGDVECLSNVINDFLKGDEKFLQRAELAKIESFKFDIKNMVIEYYNLYRSII